MYTVENTLCTICTQSFKDYINIGDNLYHELLDMYLGSSGSLAINLQDYP